MKRFNFLLLLSFLMLAPVSFTSCSDDDDDNGNGSASELVGTWEIVSNTFIYKRNGEVIEEIDETEEGLTCTFYADGRMTQAEGETAKWSYKNGILTIKHAGDWGDGWEEYDETWTVKELTSSKLVAESNDKYTEDGVTYEEYYRIEWRKVSE